MSDIDIAQVIKLVRVALDANTKAKPDDPAANPYATRTLTEMHHGVGILAAHDRNPAINLAQGERTTPIGYGMEQERLRGLREGKADSSMKRKAQARQRDQRRAQINAIADSPVVAPTERMTDAWRVVMPLMPIINLVATTKSQWAGRFLGSLVDDVPSKVMESIVLVLAKSDHDLAVLEQAAMELAEVTKATNKVPTDQRTDDERKARKEIGKGRKWLMGVINNQANNIVKDLYTETQNLRWENLDVLDTVMNNVNSAFDDALFRSSKASRAPAMMGTRFQRPEGLNSDVLSMALTAAMTDRHLDRLVEIIMDEDNRRIDGAVKWAECAEAIFRADPDGAGEHKWMLVQQATQHLEPQRRYLADAARKFVRAQFAWLPQFVWDLMEALDFAAIGYVQHDGFTVAQMRSEFECYLDRGYDAERLATARPTSLRPALTFESPAEAAFALMAHFTITTSEHDALMTAIDHA